MGTKARDIRITHTKKSLIDAFIELANVKDFEQITILDLTERAHVNRTTFYAHFKDKYDLLDHIIGDSASGMIEKYTANSSQEFNREIITQLFFAVCEVNQQPDFPCRNSYFEMIPLLKERIFNAVRDYLSKRLIGVNDESEISFYAPIYANIVVEAGYLWTTGKLDLTKEETAQRVTDMVVGKS
ncbi:TetR/AcrR family transcriptional regulator [Paenibacillus hodogayensis]|uniref:TetR/AcrR family transcriptional regulator n=1 Tax=Paenibacillus hodogayensis TaxID=279208 RepID=A0ABV5W0D8_9BACL